MERILAIRRIVTRINYSEKTISVGVRVRRPGGAPAVDLARPTDDRTVGGDEMVDGSKNGNHGKFVLNHRPTRAALSAAQIESPSARTSESESCSSPRTTKKPGRSSRPDLMSEFASLPNGGVLSLGPKIGDTPELNPEILLTFPNIAHKFWDAYRQGGGVHLRRSRAQILSM
jgi:hypothetical protein